MRIGISGWGSEGDLRPLVALGARLRKAGHEVRLALSPIDEMDYAPVCQELDLALRVVPEQSRMPNLRVICEAAQSSDISKVSRALMDEAFYPFQEEMYQATLELCAQSDLVIGLFSSHYVKAACEKSGRPYVSVHYYPGMFPSRERPPPGFPAWRWLNPIAWWLLHKLIDLAFLAPAARFWASKGLRPVRHTIPDVQGSDRLNLLAASPTLFPAPKDWTGLHSVCGEFAMPEPAAPWKPSDGLCEFLAAGEKPILVSFGTLEHLAPERARDLAVASTRQAKVRAIVQTKVGAEGRDGDLYFLRWAPHRSLLPLCSAMVLHGGAGTTHAALRAGVPAVVVPFIIEQRLWGGLLHRAGSALEPLSFWKASPEKLGALIQEAATSQTLHQRARELAAQVAREDGTGTACALLEKLAVS